MSTDTTDDSTGRMNDLREAIDGSERGFVTASDEYADFKANTTHFSNDMLERVEDADFAFVFCLANDDGTFDAHFVDQTQGTNIAARNDE
jgi:hypothetical protein